MRWRNYINLYEMTYADAARIFKQNGVDVSQLDATGVKNAYRRLMMANHPDRGGDVTKAKDINAAFDVLKLGAPSGSRADTSGFQWQSTTQQRYEQRRREREAQNRGDQNQGDTTWAQAGHSGGAPNSSSIHRNDYTDMNYFKKRMWELSGKSRHEWNINAFDGAFFRSSITVYGNEKIFPDMAAAMVIWNSYGGNPYKTRAVFVNRSNAPEVLFLIYLDGKHIDPPIAFRHNSFNANASNDQQFVRSLPEKLDKISAGNVSEAWAPKPRTEDRIPLDYASLVNKAFRVTGPSGNPAGQGFSIVTPENGSAWTKWADRPQFDDIVRQRLNDPTFLADHKYVQIVNAAKKLRLI